MFDIFWNFQGGVGGGVTASSLKWKIQRGGVYGYFLETHNALLFMYVNNIISSITRIFEANGSRGKFQVCKLIIFYNYQECQFKIKVAHSCQV